MSLTQTSEKSKRIASNTGAIYIRMIVVMLATLYTSRIVLQQLGVIDFGINNVVAGIVSLLAFFPVVCPTQPNAISALGWAKTTPQKPDYTSDRASV